MILADKIISLRKKAGWSQEELAGKLGVTRQSVSKWEGAQSVPDLDKVIQMSRIFGVSTDYLLKEEMGEPEYIPSEKCPEEKEATRLVTMEEAAEYLELRRKAAPRLAAATFLYITSPICLILLGALSEYQSFGISENLAGGIGLCILMVMVTLGVVLSLTCGFRSKPYEYLEKEVFETEYGVIGMVSERKSQYQSTYSRLNITGTVCCIMSVIPLFAAMGFDNELLAIFGVCILLLLVALGCIAFVYGGVIEASMEKLLQEGDYTRTKKKHSSITGTISVVYWLAVTAFFFWYTFGPNGNGHPEYSWVIWAIAGVLFGAVMAVVKLIESMRKP